jgi:hypothetical protein
MLLYSSVALLPLNTMVCPQRINCTPTFAFDRLGGIGIEELNFSDIRYCSKLINKRQRGLSRQPLGFGKIPLAACKFKIRAILLVLHLVCQTSIIVLFFENQK